MTAPTMWSPPPAPERDLWWHALRIAAPNTDDWAGRHRRGSVRLPYDLGQRSAGLAGDVVEAWVCCDPACGGVELGESPLELNHGCCGLTCHGKTVFVGQKPGPRGRCRAAYKGGYHGPFTAWWEPDGGVR